MVAGTDSGKQPEYKAGRVRSAGCSTCRQRAGTIQRKGIPDWRLQVGLCRPQGSGHQTLSTISLSLSEDQDDLEGQTVEFLPQNDRANPVSALSFGLPGKSSRGGRSGGGQSSKPEREKEVQAVISIHRGLGLSSFP